MSFAFLIDQERWEDLDSDYPTRFIDKFSLIREISAVTFPAYNATDINARSKTALESARAALESERRQKAEAVDTADIELAKAKYFFKSKF